VEYPLEGEYRARFGRELNKVGDAKKTTAFGGGGVGLSVTVTSGKSFKATLSKVQNLGPGQGEPKDCVKVTLSEEMLQMLECCYVGELV